MLDRARLYQTEQQVENIQWLQGSVTELPFAAGSFDCVVTRFSFHHFLSAQQALDEMTRVAKPGGTVLVCDVAPRKEAQDRFNEWEILRDPSHTRALTQAEFEELGLSAGLALRRAERYGLQMGLENLLSGSFPKPGDADRIRALFNAEVLAGTDSLGVAARREAEAVRITYPVVVMAWQKQA
jgi:SAM-dependent methyltransferase